MRAVAARVAALKARMRLPVIAAPMFLVSSPEMVIAACRAKIAAALPGPNARRIDDLRSSFAMIDAHTGRNDAPWVFNMITHVSYGRFDEELALVEEFRPELVVTALGAPDRVTDVVHGYGGLVFADVNSPAFARKAVDKGADGLVLVTSGAGGHTGSYAMMPFLDEVRRHFDGPIALAGGIGSGRAVRATEVLGAEFAYVGTRFLGAAESLMAEDYRRMVMDCDMEDLIASRAVTGALANWLRPSIAAAGLSDAEMATAAKIDFSGDLHAGARAWKTVWSAGQGVGGVTAIEPMADIIAELAQDYDAACAGADHPTPTRRISR